MTNFNSNNFNTTTNASEEDEYINDLIRDVIEPYAEILLDTEYSVPPPNIMVPPEVWRQKKKQEIIDSLSGAEVRGKIKKGMEIIFDYVNTQLPPLEAEKVNKEWSEGIELYSEMPQAPITMPPLPGSEEEKLEKEAAGKGVEEEPEPIMEEVMKLTPATIEHFYSAGLRQFQEGRFKEAAAVFTSLVVLNPNRHNTWLALGMSLENDNDMELAIQALDMAVATDPEDSLPYIHLAQCYIKNRQFDQAKSNLEKAQEVAKNSPDKEELISFINGLKNECR